MVYRYKNKSNKTNGKVCIEDYFKQMKINGIKILESGPVTLKRRGTK